MKLMLQKKIDDVIVDGYAENDEAWFTRTQIGELLEYSEPRTAILRIHEKHKDRLDRFSTVARTATVDGKIREVFLYNIRGVFEICRWSDQPKADEIMDQLYDMAEEVSRKGYYTAIPETQLAELLIANMNDREKLEHVIIPAMRDASVEQIDLVASYMGLSKIPQRLFNISEDNRRAKRLIDDWREHGAGVYTSDDFPKPYDEHPAALVALDYAKRSKKAFGKFAQFCGVEYFNRDGYLMIIDQMLKRGFIKPELAKSWSLDVRGLDKRCWM